MTRLTQRNKKIGSLIQNVAHEKLERIAIACENMAEYIDFLAASRED